MKSRKQINEMEVRYILSHPGLMEQQRSEIKKMLLKLQHESEHLDQLKDDFIAARSLAGRDPTKDVLSRTNNQGGGLLEIIETSENNQREYILGLLEQFRALELQMEAIQRVWLCFDSLDAEARQILKGLYCKKLKWICVEDEMNMNHRSFTEKRDFAMKTLMERFNSELSFRELGKMKNYNVLQDKPKSKKQKKEILEGQLSLFKIGGQ